MMETFRTYCSIDTYGRLNILSSTQIVFHCRRIVANALHIPKSMVRVSKPADMSRLRPQELERIGRMVDEVKDPYQWEIQINALISRYILRYAG